MFELILMTIKDNLTKVKQEIIENVTFQIDRDTAEIRYELLEIKRLLREQTTTSFPHTTSFPRRRKSIQITKTK